MVLTVASALTEIDDCDTDNWTGDPSIGLDTDFQREGTGCIGMDVDIETITAVSSSFTAANYTGRILYFWMFSFTASTLDLKSAGGMHLYEFKPHQPPAMAGYNTYWPTDTWFADIYSGILLSRNLPGGVSSAAGRYKIKVEVYDQSGNKVAPGAGTFQFIVPTGVASDGVTIETRHANTNSAYGPVEIEDDGFVFYLHIDNRECTATIDAPTIGAASAGDVCGFLRYEPGDMVDVDFHALHPDNFATFAFWIRRAHAIINSASGEVSAAVAGVYTGDGNGTFEHDFPVGSMLGPCNEAAFAEILRVYAKATNGWDRLRGYDDHDERAFALAPKPVP